MTIPDPTAVRAAAIRVLNYVDDESVCATTVARAYLDLTDPTPLTVEVLMGMGFVVKSANLETWKRGTLIASKQYDGFAFATESMAYVWPAPRTAGHLAMLLAMMEGR